MKLCCNISRNDTVLPSFQSPFAGNSSGSSRVGFFQDVFAVYTGVFYGMFCYQVISR